MLGALGPCTPFHGCFYIRTQLDVPIFTYKIRVHIYSLRIDLVLALFANSHGPVGCLFSLQPLTRPFPFMSNLDKQMTKGQGTEAGGMRTDVDKLNGSKFSQAIWDSCHGVCRCGTGSLVRCGEPPSKSEIMVTWHGWGTESPPLVLHRLLQFLR